VQPPAWPASWDARFKLHLPEQTVIPGEVKDEEMVDWSIEPASRKGDVRVFDPQVEKNSR
jgi:hypothetical protein